MRLSCAILAPAYTGHLNPITVLGRELQRRGHRIAVIAPLAAGSKVREAGLEFLPLAAREFPEGEWERLTGRMGELAGMTAARFIGHWLGRLTRGIHRDLPGIVAQERFDGLVMDQICLGTENVCAVLGLPLAVACNAMTLHAEPGVPPMQFSWRHRSALPFRLRNLLGLVAVYSTGWPVTRELLRYRSEHHLPFLKFHHMNEMPPSLVQVAQQPAFFDFPRRHLPDHFYYTGPWTERNDTNDDGFPWNRLNGRPLIYASMGTLQNRLPNVFRMIAEACAGLNVQLVLALGREGASLSENLPGSPIVVDFAPQVALLRRATLAITHGGLNTILESLSEGVPLVVIPVTNDQPGNAARVAHLRVGEFVPLHRLTAATLQDAVSRVLATPGYRERAMDFTRAIRLADGPVRAADLIVTAFTTRRRVVAARGTG